MRRTGSVPSRSESRPLERRIARRVAVSLLVCTALPLSVVTAGAQMTLPVRILASASGAPVLQQPTRFVGNGDVVVWVATNEVAHGCDRGGRSAAELRVSFTTANPTTESTLSAAIPLSGQGPAALPVELASPLASRKFSYRVDIADERGDALCSVGGELVKSIALTVRSTSGVPQLDVATQSVGDGDNVLWTITNTAAHLCDAGIRTAVEARIVFDAADPTASNSSLAIEIPPKGEGDVTIGTRLRDPLAAQIYAYQIELVNQLGRVQCSVSGALSRSGTGKGTRRPTHQRPARPPRPPRPPRG